jgi:hypothetical protein
VSLGRKLVRKRLPRAVFDARAAGELGGLCWAVASMPGFPNLGAHGPRTAARRNSAFVARADEQQRTTNGERPTTNDERPTTNDQG